MATFMVLGELVHRARAAPRPAAPAWRLPLAGALLSAGGAMALLRPRERGEAWGAAPVRASSYFSPDELRRARRFRRGQLAIGLAGGAAELAALTAVARREPGRRRRRERPRAGRGAAAGAGLSLVAGAAGLPAAAVSRRRGVAIGLVTQGWGGWAADVAKASGLRALAAGAAGASAVALRRRFGERWWLPGAALATTAAAGLGLVAPLLLEPLFNRFEPLEDGELRNDVLDLARRAGAPARTVLVADASRRSTAYNAYVSGLGRTRRVVFFDTLLRGEGAIPAGELRTIVAHELSHVRHRDMARLVAYAALVAGPAARAADRLARRLAPAAPADSPPALAALLLGASAVSAVVGVPANALSRAVERQADRFALRLTGDPGAMIAFHRRIVTRNVADPDPPALLTRLMATHPPTVERIGLAEAFASGRA